MQLAAPPFRIAAAVLASSFLLGARPARAQFAITDLGILSGYPSAQANAVNSKGQVVGSAYGQNGNSGNTRAFFWDSGTLKDLKTLTGGAHSGAASINASGQVAGYSLTSANKYHAVLFDSSGVHDLGAGDFSFASGINGAGKIVGQLSTTDNGNSVIRAFLKDATGIHQLGNLTGKSYDSSYATAINASDQIAGWANDTLGDHAFLYDSQGMHDLGTLGGPNSYANGLNDLGEVVGNAHNTDVKPLAFLYDRQGMHSIDTLNNFSSNAKAINNLSDVVGTAQATFNGPSYAFFYRSGQMTDLNTLIPANSGWNLASANGINDRGQIVGVGQKNGQYRPFLLTPKFPTVAGTITLEGCVNLAQTLTFTFRPTGGGNAIVRAAMLDATGAFRLDNIPAGTYNLAVKGSKWLQEIADVDASQGNALQVALTLPAGDVTDDNFVDIDDLGALAYAYGTTPSSPRWNPQADLTCDNKIDLDDLALLAENYGLAGAP